MKKVFVAGLCAAVLCCGLSFGASPVKASPADLTGVQWKLSTSSEKLAFLYGVSSTVAIEQLIAEQRGVSASPFVKAWMAAFGDTSWKDIQKCLDDWYAAHPDDAERSVFDVLWYEFMAPSATES